MKLGQISIGNVLEDEEGFFIVTPSFYQLLEVNLVKSNPILISEEWHNKFGVYDNGNMAFEYVLPRKNNIDCKVIFTGDYVFIRQGLKWWDDDIISIWNKDLTRRDMYVHEWQNLYNILAGEELKFNL
jgi:hypothetical protein